MITKVLTLTTLHGETDVEDLKVRHQARVDAAVQSNSLVPPAFVAPPCDVIAVFRDEDVPDTRLEFHTSKWEEAIALKQGMKITITIGE